MIIKKHESGGKPAENNNKPNEHKDMSYLNSTVEKLKKHVEKNKHDYKTKRTLLIKEAKLRKLKNYFKRKEK